MSSMHAADVKNPKKNSHKSSQAAGETRAALLDAGQKQFCERGFTAASVHDIAREAGVNVSLISYHFGNKEGLFKACLERVGTDRLSVAQRVLAQKPESIDEVRVRLGMFIDEMLLDGIQNPETFAILYRDLHAEFYLIEDIFKKTFLRAFELLTEFLTVARDRGLLASWVDPRMSAVQIIGAVVHVFRTDSLRQKLFNETIRTPELQAHTRDYIIKSTLEGLCVKP